MYLKTKILAAFITIVSLTTSCKKESQITEPPTNTTPTTTDVELLGAETDKLFHYNFNNTLKDGSGNNKHALDSANITYTTDRFGRPNQAAVFSNSKSRIKTPLLSSQELSFPYTISLWVNMNEVETNQMMIQSNPNSSKYYGYWLQHIPVEQGPRLAFSFGNGGGTSASSRNTIISSKALTPNTWSHIVIVVKGFNNMELYINGAKDSNSRIEGDAQAMMLVTNTETLGIIGSAVTDNAWFNGKMDDYRLYKKALTTTEISNLYSFKP